MLFIDNMKYKEDRAVSPEKLAEVTNIHIYWYLVNKAYGTLESGGNNLLNQCCFTTMKYHDKAISYFMPQRCMAWDEIQKEGNPTKSQAVNNLIKKIVKHEVRRTGAATAAYDTSCC
jgi:hypothetical protein